MENLENVTPAGSQENALSGDAAPTDRDGEPTLSPVFSLPSSQQSIKPRKPPSVTPRTFTRFFTPKSSLERAGRIGASRQALRDITASASNRRGKGRRTPTKDTIQIFEDDFRLPSGGTGTKKKKRKIPDSLDVTRRSSPLKRIRNQSVDVSDSESAAEDTNSSDDAVILRQRQGIKHRQHPKRVHPILQSGYRKGLGRDLQREIGGYGKITKARCLAQHETSTFYTTPKDVHDCNNLGLPTGHSLPFCSASCNTNSLVAIGDEDGGVRLLESSNKLKPGFSKAYLTFRPHVNAILDLAFSPDDLLLATASGDQTSQVIDMPTQCTTHKMTGHSSSVKQVCFQPGSSNVLASSSRDGSVQIWDLRCKGLDAPVRSIKVSLDGSVDDTTRVQANKMIWARPINTILEAHHQVSTFTAPVMGNKPSPNCDPPSKTETPGRRGDVSITAISFLELGRENMLMTASEADAAVRLWDLRTTHNSRRNRATPLSTTRPTGSHTKHRHFGVTSMSLSGDGARLYTVCRDNTVYAYSTSHLQLGHAPELSKMTNSKPRRSGGHEKEGLGPIYGFRHPKFHASTFYVKSALRAAKDDKTELLAVGSSDGCAVLFPTDERYMNHSSDQRIRHSADLFGSTPPSLTRTVSSPGVCTRVEDSIPIYQYGSALIRGHDREVTGMSWTHEGELVTVSDDFTARCWREGAGSIDLRMGGENEGRRWGCGWAEADPDWDEDDG